MSQFNVSSCCLQGCVRSTNEDMILAHHKFLRSESNRQTVIYNSLSRSIFAVADGMGGHESGEVASSETLRDLEFFFYDMPQGLSISEFNDAMVSWLESVNRKISHRETLHPGLNEMGTTLVAMAYYEGHFFRMHCGDSRLYLFSEGQLRQLTIDHSLNTFMGEEKHSNIITNCIGGGCTTSYMDIFDIQGEVKRGDMLLLCSDGLNDMLPDSRIAGILSEGGDAETLAEAAVMAGGYDNVSACLITIE